MNFRHDFWFWLTPRAQSSTQRALSAPPVQKPEFHPERDQSSIGKRPELHPKGGQRYTQRATLATLCYRKLWKDENIEHQRNNNKRAAIRYACDGLSTRGSRHITHAIAWMPICAQMYIWNAPASTPCPKRCEYIGGGCQSAVKALHA